MPITILFDNHIPDSKQRNLWGFAAYVHEYKLLFDTGSNGRALLQNMKQLGIDVAQIKYLFLSHEHWDHIGGVDSVIEANPNLTIFAPDSLSKNMIADLRTQSREVIVCDEHPRKLIPGLYSTGIQGKEAPEHALVIDGTHPTLITGCGHYGIERIVERAESIINTPIEKIIGGFHLHSHSREKIQATIRRLKEQGITHALPTHCTGDRAIALFEEDFGEGFHIGGIGAKM